MMENKDWKLVFTLCNEILGQGTSCDSTSKSWCAWTTFDRLESRVLYWNSGIPSKNDINEDHIGEGVWHQPFLYKSLAHLIIPRSVHWESMQNNTVTNGLMVQDIDRLALNLLDHELEHHVSKYWLEIKLF